MTFATDISRRQLLTAAATSVLATSTAWAQSTTPRVLRVGHQKGWLSILKGRGTLEKRLALLIHFEN